MYSKKVKFRFLFIFVFLTLIVLTTFTVLKVLKDIGANDNHILIFIKLILSVSTIYILGVLWLGIFIGWDKPIFQLGVTPFLLAELFKICLLTLIAKKIIKFKKFI